jgi:tetratricopeptide (TPR) repeat protein
LTRTLTLVFTLALASTPAFADPSMLRETDDATRGGTLDPAALRQTEARRRFQLGRAHYEAGRWDSALSEFEAGYASWPAPSFLVNRAQCLKKLDRPAEAAGAYQKYLDTNVGDADVRSEVTEARDDLITEIDQRMYFLAESAALFDSFLRSRDGSPELRVRVNETRKEVLRTLVHMDAQIEAWAEPARRAVSQRRQLRGWLAFKWTIRRSSP